MRYKPGDKIPPGEPLYDMHPPDSESQDFLAALKLLVPPLLLAGCVALFLRAMI
jgi:hypothetical protein